MAGYEMPQTILLNYSYELPFGHGRQFMSNGQGLGYKILDQVIGGWNIAGTSTWNPKGMPVLMPDVPGGVTAPGATLRYSLAPGAKVVQSTDYSAALANPYKSEFLSANPKPVLNSSAFVKTDAFTLSNAPFVFPNVRNPGSFFTDATLLKKFPFSAEGTRYFRVAAGSAKLVQPR